MEASNSRVLGLLRDNRLATVMKSNLCDPRVIEIAGLCGVDAVWLCQEHVPMDWLALENLIRAARIHRMDTIVRVARGSYSDYIRPLEAGATGIMVPHVGSAEEARQIVEWVRFHPEGRRALDGGNVEGRFCLLPNEQYVEQTNRERLIILQIESPEALAQVDEIAAIEGFDALLFGPGDYSHLIGKIGQIQAAEVVEARRRVGAAARRHSKFAMSAGLLAPLDTLVAEGYQMFGIGADVIALSSYLQEKLRNFHQAADVLPASARSVYE